MSLALKIPEATPSHPPYRLSDTELRLRDQFVAAFNDSAAPGWELHRAIWDLTDELKAAGELPEAVLKRIKYIAAIPVSFHYRVGYKAGHDRLRAAVTLGVSLCIARYFSEAEGTSRLSGSRQTDRGDA